MQSRFRNGVWVTAIAVIGFWIWGVGGTTTWEFFTFVYTEIGDEITHRQNPPATQKAPNANPPTFVALTFDDVPKSVQLATRELEAVGIRGTYFAITDTPDTNAGHLSWRYIRKLHARGHEVGSHTKSHAIIRGNQNTDHVWDEIYGSRQKIAQELGIGPEAVVSFSPPKGQYDREDIETIKAAGYSYAVTGWGDGPNIGKLKHYVLVRYDVTTERSLEELFAFIDNAIVDGKETKEPSLIIPSSHSFEDQTLGKKELSQSNKLTLNIKAFKRIVQYLAQKRDAGDLYVGTLEQAVHAYEQYQASRR